jgi:hypothetical protein
MSRSVQPEMLDALSAADPRAAGSRADLRRLNFLMGHAGILARAIRGFLSEKHEDSRPLHLVEIGAGDGTLLLTIARRLSALPITARATMVDRQDLISPESRQGFAALGWSVESVAADVFDWLGQTSARADVLFTNLFLHHFPDKELEALLRLAAARTNLFIACEPRRSPVALAAARCLGVIGCNSVTRHDAVVSVRAGFAGREISALWPRDAGWKLSEGSAGLFSHFFVAQKNA